MTPWKLPLIVLAIALPTTFSFYFGGPGVGVTVGAVVAVAIVVVAVRQRPRGALGVGGDADVPARLMVVAASPVEEEQTVAGIAAAAGRRAAVLVLAPARIGFLDRWASDLEGARREAQRNLVLAVAALAKAGIEAEARVGDEDIVQAVEDQLGSFEATEVILVSAAPAEDPRAAEAAAELSRRLRPRFRWFTPAARDSGPGPGPDPDPG